MSYTTILRGGRLGAAVGLCGLLACSDGSSPSATAAHPAGSGGAAGSSGGAAGSTGGQPGVAGLSGVSGAGAGGSATSEADGSPPTAPDDTEDARADSARDAGAPLDASGDVAVRSGCAGAAFALCEDFESGPLDAKVWKLTQQKGTVTLDPSRGARGSKTSVHVHVDPGSDTTVGLVEAKTFPALAKGLFARAFIYIPGATATSLFTGDRHSRLIYAQGATPYGEYALGIWNGGLIQNHYSKTDDSVDTKMLPPFDQWFCLEYQLDSAAGNVRAFLNGAEITALRHDGWPPSNIDTLMFGVDRYGSFPVAEDVWFDDLAVDSARIGCDR